MSFFKEIADKIGRKATGGYNFIDFNGEYVYVEGIGRVLSLDSDKIELSVGKNVLCVTGEELVITELEKGSVIIKGRIRGENLIFS